jgi:AAA15 family ATPase/GTPase
LKKKSVDGKENLIEKMVFVSSLDLKEFSGIRAFQEPLKLVKFNILIGRNNSGKSAILHALSLLPDLLKLCN